MSRVDDVKARAEAPDYDAQLLRRWVDTHSGTMSLHEARVESVLDDLAHARTDIPDLLAVVAAARAVVEMTKRVAAELLAKAEAEGVVIDDETRTALLEGNEPGHPVTILAAALAPLLADG